MSDQTMMFDVKGEELSALERRGEYTGERFIALHPEKAKAVLAMLALDLFTGAWIYRQCQRLNAPAWIRIPALLFTLMAGPFGLLIFLVWRFLMGQAERPFSERESL